MLASPPVVMNGLSSGAVLAAFAEPLVEGRRVLVFGSALSSTPRLLLDRGARLVHVCDPVPLRVAEAVRRPTTPGLTLSTLTDEEIVAREGAVDCVLVEHLGAFDARSVVQKVRRLLAVRGVALFVTPNREARRPLLPPSEPTAAPLDYYALYDLVAAEFEHVRMLGQAPFVGYAVVDFAPDAELEPVVDSEFVPRGSEEPELFVAVAARHRPTLPGHVLVQLPLQSIGTPGAAAPVEREKRVERPAPPPELVKKLDQQEAWIKELEARAATADERADLAEDELETLRERLESAQQRDERDRSTQALEAERADAAKQAELKIMAKQSELARAVEREHAEAEAAGRERDALGKHVNELEAMLARKNAELEQKSRELEQKSRELGELKGEAAGEGSEDLVALEEKLVERGHEIRRLERDLVEAERIGKELVAELRLAAIPDTTASASTEELDALALRLATAEADKHALGWVVALGEGGKSP